MQNQFSGRTEQRKASRSRYDDALALQGAGRGRGAMYLAGYAVECSLKAKLMTQYDCRHLKELDEILHQRRLLSAMRSIFSHDLEILLRLSNGLDRVRQSRDNWNMFKLVNKWVPAWRYASDMPRQPDVVEFLGAVEKTLSWIEHNV